MQANPFDNLTDRYDAWYDSDEGSRIFAVEAACIRRSLGERRASWLEVGVGTGRFGGVAGRGESLPYLDSCFDGVLLIATICFLDDPTRAVSECARVLRKDGSLIVGMVPADSPWGKLYRRKGREGHPFYAAAKFYTCGEVTHMAGRAGFIFDEATSCLFGAPGESGEQIDGPRSGLVPNAGFVALRFSLREKGRAGSSGQPIARADPRPP
jgi:ubiquinone/menaquinone biosynthesis C-methylase UbiE